ncbi:MAG: class I SAM-dependent RNA methyltransferase [bacterium]|nr:class I SAM-dependent RNA methyltransferase [bacterium]
MKKGQTGTGIVRCVKFPNKGIVDTTEEKNIPGTVEKETVQLQVVVKNTLPGQQVSFQVNKVRGGKAEGRLLEVVKPAENEIESPCRHFGICGGCTYMTLPYEEQLKIKEQQVKELLDGVLLEQNKAGNQNQMDQGVDENAEADLARLSDEKIYRFEGIKGSPREFAYRNKMEFSFGDEVKDGPLALGMHKRGSFYDVVSVAGCQIVDEDYRKILKCALAYFREKDVSFYHKMAHIGYLRHLLVRKAVKTGEILIDLVTSSQTPPDTICMEKGLLEDFTDELCKLKLDGHIVGILHTTNDALSDTVRDDGTDILYGQDYFYEELLGLRFRITPFSFFQTNSLGAEVLYDTVREYVKDCYCTEGVENKAGGKTENKAEIGAEIKAGVSAEKKANDRAEDDRLNEWTISLHNKTVYDLYSGTGTIAQLLALVAKKVIGVEIVEEAVIAARQNVELNGLHNCEFIAGDVLKVLDEIEDKPDFIVLDPPRDGIHPKALEKIIHYGVDRIIYVSCKPTSLTRDLEILTARGYHVERACAVDMFPATANVETCVLLSHKTPDSIINVKVEFGEGKGKVPLDNIMKRAGTYKPKERVTYKKIKEYIEEKYGFKVHTAYIAEVKRNLGLPMYDASNAVEELKHPRKHPTADKVRAIKDALKYFDIIEKQNIVGIKT